MKRVQSSEDGFTLIEIVVSLTILAIISVGFLGLFTTMVQSAAVAKRRSVASSLATNQMEYLKSLPYDNLAVAGGSIYATSPLARTKVETINGIRYTVTTSINYVDDAYDGCTNYPTQADRDRYCRNLPSPSGAPSPDTNPQDYKIAHVWVTDNGTTRLAEVDTQISARVSETASTTGAMFVKIFDETGAPVSGATANVTNTTISPAANLSDTTDTNGVAIFYGLPPDSPNFDYRITASKIGYSTLQTIGPAGSLQPTYPSQNVLTQQSSTVSLTIKKQAAESLILETTDVNGGPLGNVRIYTKGGYKRYTDTANTAYYYDTVSPTDTRPITDAGGLTTLQNLVPGNYIFCGDLGATSCTVGGTTYYLVAAVPYGGSNPVQPIIVPPSEPTPTLFDYNGTNYYQKVRLMLTTSASFPRVSGLTPTEASIASGSINAFAFKITGSNLPCDAVATSCLTSVRLIQGGNTFTASCVGAATPATTLNCTVNLSTAAQGSTQLSVTANGQTLTLPASPLLGGINVVP